MSRAELFTLYINHPTRKCRLHKVSCTNFKKRKENISIKHHDKEWDKVGNGFWVEKSTQQAIMDLRERMKTHPKWRSYKYDECTIYLPLYNVKNL